MEVALKIVTTTKKSSVNVSDRIANLGAALRCISQELKGLWKTMYEKNQQPFKKCSSISMVT